MGISGGQKYSLGLGELVEKVLGESQALRVRCLEALLTAVVWILYNLGLARARVLSEKHHLCLGTCWFLGPQEVGQVRSVHCEDVVKFLKVGRLHLAGRVYVIGDAMLFESRHCSVVGIVTGVVCS